MSPAANLSPAKRVISRFKFGCQQHIRQGALRGGRQRQLHERSKAPASENRLQALSSQTPVHAMYMQCQSCAESGWLVPGFHKARISRHGSAPTVRLPGAMGRRKGRAPVHRPQSDVGHALSVQPLPSCQHDDGKLTALSRAGGCDKAQERCN